MLPKLDLSFHAVRLPENADLPALVAAARRLGLTDQDDLRRIDLPPGWTLRWVDLPLMPGVRRADVLPQGHLHDTRGRWRSTITLSGMPGRLDLTNIWFGTRYAIDFDEFEGAMGAYEACDRQIPAVLHRMKVDLGAEEAHDAVAAWLDKHYPDWRDPAAYWD
jgi:hypothetical protein